MANIKELFGDSDSDSDEDNIVADPNVPQQQAVDVNELFGSDDSDSDDEPAPRKPPVVQGRLKKGKAIAVSSKFDPHSLKLIPEALAFLTVIYVMRHAPIALLTSHERKSKLYGPKNERAQVRVAVVAAAAAAVARLVLPTMMTRVNMTPGRK